MPRSCRCGVGRGKERCRSWRALVASHIVTIQWACADGAMGWLFGGVAQDIFAQDPLVAIDQRVVLFIAQHHTSALDSGASAIAFLSNSWWMLFGRSCRNRLGARGQLDTLDHNCACSGWRVWPGIGTAITLLDVFTPCATARAGTRLQGVP